MDHSYLRITLLLGLLLGSTHALQAQEADSSSLPGGYKKSLLIGIEVPSMLFLPFFHGYSFQPMVMADVGPNLSLWAGTGLVKHGRDTVFNNLYNYRSQGYYLKGGVDIKLPMTKRSRTAFHLGMGLNVSRFKETGSVRLHYADDAFVGHPDENVYVKNLQNRSWIAAIELRQGLYADLSKTVLFFQLQESVLLRQPDNQEHTTFYISGTGVLSPRDIYGKGHTPPRDIIPAAYLYLFYRLR